LNEKTLLIIDRDDLKDKYNKKNAEFLKVRATRNILFMILGMELICAFGLLVCKFKRFIPF